MIQSQGYCLIGVGKGRLGCFFKLAEVNHVRPGIVSLSTRNHANQAPSTRNLFSRQRIFFQESRHLLSGHNAKR